MQAVDRGLTDVLAQSAHWRQRESNLIPVQDLQEAYLQQQGERRGIFTVASPRASGYAAWAPHGPHHLLPWEPNACYSPAVPLKAHGQAISAVQIHCLAINAVPVEQGP